MENVLTQWAALDVPAPIQRATFRASRSHFPIPLTDAERSLFLELIGRIDARNGQAEFWVRSENIAAAIGKSLRTIGALMGKLVDKGLIEKEQRRGRWGSFSSLTCKLTSRAAELLGLSEAEFAKAEISKRKKTADALTVKPNNVSQTKASPAFQKTAQQLPLDLQDLYAAGISLPGIFKLMRIATQSGRRLGDIVAAHIEDIKKARNPYAYLVRMLTSSEQPCQPTSQALEQQQHKHVVNQRKNLACRWFRTPKGRIVRFNENASVCELWLSQANGMPSYERTLAGQDLTDLVSNFTERSRDWIEIDRSRKMLC